MPPATSGVNGATSHHNSALPISMPLSLYCFFIAAHIPTSCAVVPSAGVNFPSAIILRVVRYVTPTNALIAKLLELEVPVHIKYKGDSNEEGIHGKKFRVTNVRDGLEVVVGGRITFDRFSASLKPEGRDLITGTAERLKGYNTKILIRGHATKEPLPNDSLYENARDLAYARAREVATELERNGVRRIRMLLITAGDTEPLVRQAYTEERRALNRRVEILVTEDLIDDYAGSTLADELKESSDGR